MARFKLTKTTTVAELAKTFNEVFGSQIRVYNGNRVAAASDILANLGLTEDCEIECCSSLTVGSFIAIMNEQGLKVAVWTNDNFSKVPDELTLEASGKKANRHLNINK